MSQAIAKPVTESPTALVPRAVPPVEQARETEFDHLAPLLDRFAATEAAHPSRIVLREKLVAGYLPVAQHIARRFAQRGEPLNDLEQVASVGLINALDRFDPSRGFHFLSFAVPTITGELRRHFRDTTWSMRVPRRLKELHLAVNSASVELSQQLGRAPRPSELAARLGASTEDILEALEASQSYRAESLDQVLTGGEGDDALRDLLGDTDPAFDTVTELRSVAPYLAALPDRERSILIMRFYHEMTQTQIAERLNISQMHVSRLLSGTLRELRAAVEQDAPARRDAP
jgi:RNA polymerase sigma-B factor